MSGLDALIERLEKLSGTDAECDVRLAGVREGWREVAAKEGEWIEFARPPDGSAFTLRCHEGGYGMPSFTASIDAALTLVPEGWQFYVANDENTGCHSCVWRERPRLQAGTRERETPALALATAAVRALQLLQAKRPSLPMRREG